MRTYKSLSLAFALSLTVAGLGCDKKADEVAPPAPAPAKTEPAPPPKTQPVAPPPKAPASAPAPIAITATDLGAATDIAKGYVGCWDLFNAGDFDKFGACYGDKAVSTAADQGTPDFVGKDAIVANAKEFKKSFSDVQGQLKLVLINGKNIASTALLVGTNDGPFRALPGVMPPTHKKLGLMALHAVTLDDAGKVQKEAFYEDVASILTQLGMIKGAGRVATEGSTAGPTIVAAKNDATEKANLDAHNAGMAAFSAHDLKGANKDLADDVVLHDMGESNDLTGREAIDKNEADFGTAFPDAKLDVSSTWAAGDYVVTTATFNGTNTGDSAAMELKATGKKVTFSMAEITRYDHGKVKEIWRFYNSFAVAMQLGLVPPPPPVPAK